MKKITKSMVADEKEYVQFKISDGANNTTDLWPSYLAGVYISDRIEDVSQYKKCDRESIYPVIAVRAKNVLHYLGSKLLCR